MYSQWSNNRDKHISNSQQFLNVYNRGSMTLTLNEARPDAADEGEDMTQKVTRRRRSGNYVSFFFQLTTERDRLPSSSSTAVYILVYHPVLTARIFSSGQLLTAVGYYPSHPLMQNGIQLCTLFKHFGITGTCTQLMPKLMPKLPLSHNPLGIKSGCPKRIMTKWKPIYIHRVRVIWSSCAQLNIWESYERET